MPQRNLRIGDLVKCLNSYVKYNVGVVIERYPEPGSTRYYICEVLIRDEVHLFRENQLEVIG